MIKDELLREAQYEATRLVGQQAGLEAKLIELEKKHLEADAALKNARLAHQRALDFRPSRGDVYMCPTCWVQRGVEAPLDNVASDDAFIDNYECTACGREFEFKI